MCVTHVVSPVTLHAVAWQSAHREKKRAARQAVRKDIPKRVEQVSQHQAFPNKPNAGYVCIPTASVRALQITYDHPAASRARADQHGGAPAYQHGTHRQLRTTGDGRRVALHHETTHSIATGTTQDDYNG
eukprot:m.497350 g.497350  ORF g.497350 m.497350 type:complete len:130 (-) comp21816_c1_seq11:543-932(-)